MQKEYRQNNKEKISKISKEYYQNHKEKIKEYYQNNKEEILHYKKQYSLKKKLEKQQNNEQIISDDEMITN